MIALIAAKDPEGVIGKNNELPWNIPSDLEHFKKTTSGKTVLMGRKTFESIGRPLPNRNNLVISTTMEEREGIDVCRSIEEGLEKAKAYGEDVYVIGGSKIYEQTMPLADKLVISNIKEEYEGDAYFPPISFDWAVESKEDKGEFELIIYTRKEKG